MNTPARKSVERLRPEESLPQYAYVPGRTPHPTGDPDGHSYQLEIVVLDFDPHNWRHCRAYCWGVDLFNCGYYWEAHEAWEAVWIAVGRRGMVADFLKALIKLAAAGVKAREGRENGVRRHARRARQLFSQVQQSHDQLLGLDVATLAKFAQELDSQAGDVLDSSDGVKRVWPFVLRPQDAASS